MLLTLVVGPLTSRSGPAAAVLIGNAPSVSLLQWAMLQGMLGSCCLRPSRPRGGALTVEGTVLFLGQLIGLMIVFRAEAGSAAAPHPPRRCSKSILVDPLDALPREPRRVVRTETPWTSTP